MGASRAADGDDAPHLGDLLDDWAEIDLDEEAVVVCAADGTIIGGADVLKRDYSRVSVYGYVHPSWRGLGIGRALVNWGEAWTIDHMHRAPSASRVVVDHFILAEVEPAKRLLHQAGYAPVRTTLVMSRELQTMPPSERVPGIRIRTYRTGADDLAVFQTGEAAFADMWGRPTGTLESWTAATHAPGFDPGLWFLAEDVRTTQVLGLCLAQMAGGGGWIRSLGVRPEARRRGVGRALLLTAFAALRERGARRVELSVDADSPTRAPNVYRQAGMTVDRSFLLYQKELRGGQEFGAS
jgi:mycothiol synthase